MTKGKLQLPDVTICAADSAFVDFTVRALARSTEQVEFGDAILFSDSPREGPFRCARIPALTSVDAYSHFCLREMASWIKTPYVLIVQWDGYVINPDAWANAFRKYDYIGAAWHGLFPPERMVGNGGFSLRSHRLLKAAQQLPISVAPEDRTICHQYREKLERDFGVRFAPVRIADRFSYEYKEFEMTPFGFHGIYHLWKHMSEADLNSVAEQLDIVKTIPDRVMRLVVNCAANGREEAAALLYRRIRARLGAARVHDVLAGIFPPDEAKANLRLLEGLIIHAAA